jgi:hypothetical protein
MDMSRAVQILGDYEEEIGQRENVARRRVFVKGTSVLHEDSVRANREPHLVALQARRYVQ